MLRPPFFASNKNALLIGFALGVAAVSLALLLTLKDEAPQFNERYGEALVRAAAREAMEAAFRKDLVSLRAIAENLSDNPEVLRASIHDTDNRLLVQAGEERRLAPQHTVDFEAPITVHDSVAGFVRLGLSHKRSHIKLVRILCAGLLLSSVICVVFLLLRSLTQTPRTKPAATGARRAHSTQTDDHSPPERTPEPERAWCVLCVKNMEVLTHQLNGQVYRDTFSELAKRIEHIAKLYGASVDKQLGNRYVLGFRANDSTQALFNAACAARLMLETTAIIHRVPLDLAAQISSSYDELSKADMPFTGLAINGLHDCTLLSEKVSLINVSDEHPERKLVIDFASPYKLLLENQIDQIRGALNSNS